MKRKVLLSVITLFMLLIAGLVYELNSPETKALIGVYGKPEYMKVDTSKDINSQTRLVEIGGRQFNFPLKYIDGRMEKGIVQADMLFKYMLPDFKSLYDLKDRQEYLKEFNAGNETYMLIEPQANMPPMAVSVHNLNNQGRKTKYIGNDGAFEKYEWYANYDGKMMLDEYFYIEKDKNKIILSYIICDVDTINIMPGCEHEFIDKGLRYNISYTKKNYFNSWQLQREKAIKFIDSFEIKKSDTRK